VGTRFQRGQRECVGAGPGTGLAALTGQRDERGLGQVQVGHGRIGVNAVPLPACAHSGVARQ
jgi:hypothetical protein